MARPKKIELVATPKVVEEASVEKKKGGRPKATANKKIVKIKTGKKKSNNSRAFDSKYTGEEPSWDDYEKLTPEEFNHKLHAAYNWYNYYYTIKDFDLEVINYLSRQHKFKAKQIAKVKALSSWRISLVVRVYAKLFNSGINLNHGGKDVHEWILNQVNNAIETPDYSLMNNTGDSTDSPKKKSTSKKEKFVITIQDRLREQCSDIGGVIEETSDLIRTTKKPVEFKAYDLFKERNMPQQFCGKLLAHFQPMMNELIQSQSKKPEDASVVEGYQSADKKVIKLLVAFYKSVIDDIESYNTTKKTVKKTRVKKAPSKEKVVSKLKFLKEDLTLKVASVAPSSIIGATQVWIYNVKTRKLGVINADPQIKSLSIKGTYIEGYDTKTSVSKTLRKPAEQIKEFMTAGKIKLRTFLTSIKATEVLFNGKINKDTLLLKVM